MKNRPQEPGLFLVRAYHLFVRTVAEPQQDQKREYVLQAYLEQGIAQDAWIPQVK